MALRTAEYWIEEYRKREAYWLHDGNPKRPHALLTSGLHSNGFFNSKPVIADDALLREVSADIVDLYLQSGGVLIAVDRVIGPQTGATKLAEFVAYEISNRRGRRCGWASPKKVGEGNNKSMVFDDPARKPYPNEFILLVEDVITTGSSLELTAKAVSKAAQNALFSSFVCTLVNRSGLTEVNGRKIIALIEHEMPIWTPEECPLCELGSEAIRPKENWALLNSPVA